MGSGSGVDALAGLPEAAAWFVRQRMGDGITLISEPHVHPLLRCNVWHVEGRDRDLVVDTAMGIRPLRHLVERELGGPCVAVATHAHVDHIGGLGEFDVRLVHPAEADVVASASRASVEAAHYPESVLGPYRRAGVAIPDVFVDAVPSGGLDGSVWEVDPAPATRLIGEGDVIDLGDRTFEVLHLPGHSPGSIGLWERASGVLFSGDAVYDGPLLDELDGADVDEYVATVERLRRLAVTVVHGGHERSFDRQRLVQICDAYLASRASGAAT